MPFSLSNRSSASVQGPSSLYIFSAHNKFRKALVTVVSHMWFEYFILLLIFCSNVAIAMEMPLKVCTPPWDVCWDGVLG